ncbi:MAG: hypothetical protein IPG44_11675 [Anaerolineales bacterium]|nr:hypothetical protein [Anaerolineales bacterium]
MRRVGSARCKAARVAGVQRFTLAEGDRQLQGIAISLKLTAWSGCPLGSTETACLSPEAKIPA